TLGQKFHSFMKSHSVTFGEIGLRYAGGVMLVFPLSQTVIENGKKTFVMKDAFRKGGKRTFTEERLAAIRKLGYDPAVKPVQGMGHWRKGIEEIAHGEFGLKGIGHDFNEYWNVFKKNASGFLRGEIKPEFSAPKPSVEIKGLRRLMNPETFIAVA